MSSLSKYFAIILKLCFNSEKFKIQNGINENHTYLIPHAYMFLLILKRVSFYQDDFCVYRYRFISLLVHFFCITLK